MPKIIEHTDQYFVYGAYGELLAQYNGLSLSYWNILAGGETIGRAHPDESRYYYLKDHTSTTLSTGLGSVRVTVTDEGTAIGWEACPEPAFRRSRRDYFPFGLQIPGRSYNQGNAFDDQKLTGHFLEPACRRQSGRQEGGLGLYHAVARMYDPETGRFWGVDAMRSAMPGWNTYHYTFNNPVRYVDPDGNMPKDDIRGRRTTIIRHRFNYDKTPSGNKKRTGTDTVRKSVVSRYDQTTVTVTTSLTIDSDGQVSDYATQRFFVSTGTGANHSFFMFDEILISTENVDTDLIDIANSIGEYKDNNGGDSPLQEKADNNNLLVSVGVGGASALLTAGWSKIAAVLAGAAGSAATYNLSPVSPENLSTTLHKKEEVFE